MKLICFDTDTCGFVTKDLENADYNIDFNKDIQVCPECGSIAVLVNDSFQFTENLQLKKEKEMLDVIEQYKKILKL
jgi:hypothetical protein